MDYEMPLTPREKEVYLYICEYNMPTADIAKKMYLSKSTVLTHINKIYEKKGVSNRATLIYEYYKEKKNEKISFDSSTVNNRESGASCALEKNI